jgi:hypothetical protein
MSVKHYLVCGYTAKGFRNLLSTNLQTLNRLFVLNGGPDIWKSKFMEKFGGELAKLPYDVEYIHCPLNPASLDGVLIPKLGMGIINGTLLQTSEPADPKIVNEIADLELIVNADKLSVHKQEIQDIQNNMQKHIEQAYAEFAKGLKVHDEWEKIYISNMNFAKADLLTEKVIGKLFGRSSLNKTGCIRHRFFGGSTPEGPVDYVENITGNTATRYFIKGRPGSGKSTMLKKILKSAQNRGMDTEVYHCGFDPDSLDMLLFPELRLCIFDSTSPHEYYPSLESDRVIDMYSTLVTSGTDELYENELADIIARYKAFTGEGTAQLASAKTSLEKLEQIYNDATDFYVIDRICNELLLKTLKFRS